MPGPFDHTTRYLVQAYPDDWLTYLGFDAASSVEVIDTKLTTVSTEADKVLRVNDDPPWILHLEFQSGYDATIGARLASYNTRIEVQESHPVATVLVLLRPRADGPANSGRHGSAIPGRPPHLHFGYTVRRVWQEPPDELLDWPLGVLPLAPLGAVGRPALPGLIRAMDRRFGEEADRAEAERLRVVTYTLLGLRFPVDVVEQLMPGLRNMRDSSTYQAIVEEGLVRGRAEGRIAGERRLLLLLGEARLGPPDAVTRARVDALSDVDEVERLARRVLTASSWAELLAAP